MRTLKADSSRWVGGTLAADFAWQEGYGAFTISPGHIERVTTYIRNQKQHHREVDFQTEYATILNEHGVEYDPRYLW